MVGGMARIKSVVIVWGSIRVVAIIGRGRKFILGGLTCIAISHWSHSSKRANCETRILGGGGGFSLKALWVPPPMAILWS